ncbi:hypothetical protein BDR03DRAFT_975180 [Suillus americanus]|nr:hypothetical protein BDR03DRAFT_975180 [Suillus americanus]
MSGGRPIRSVSSSPLKLYLEKHKYPPRSLLIVISLCSRPRQKSLFPVHRRLPLFLPS